MNGAQMQMPSLTKAAAYSLASFIIALIFCTYLRVSLLFVYPLLVILIFIGYGWKLDRNAIYLLLFALACWIFSFRHGLFLKYNFLSLYFFIPLMLMLFSVPRANEGRRDLLDPLILSISVVMAVNNVFGIIQYINHPFDDSFEGLYGTFTVSQNGLSIINSLLFFYYINRFVHTLKQKYLVAALFFIICSIMGFYGAGLIAFLGAYFLTFFRMRLRTIIGVAFALLFVVGLAYLLMKVVSPLALDYNVNIIKKFLDPTSPSAPRKVVIFKNYVDCYSGNITDLLFGSGPGTFNSRSAFMVGSPSYFQVDFLKSDVQPPYFSKCAYPLWNASNTGPYDGFMNQPFSSLLALLGEYGLLFVLGAFYVIAGKFSVAVKNARNYAVKQGVQLEFKMFRFCMFFAAILLVIDNYMEYPEIIALLLLVAKLSHQQMKSAFDDVAQET